MPDAQDRAATYAACEQDRLVGLITAGDFYAYPDGLRFVLAVHAAGIPTAAASSSKNADTFLRAIRLDTFAARQAMDYDFVRPGMSLLDLFDANLSGRDFAHGKPDPEIFLISAAELRVTAASCFVVEDAASGVQAAKAGGMAALGVARAADEPLLEAAHADLVVTSLDEVDLTALARGQLARRVEGSA